MAKKKTNTTAETIHIPAGSASGPQAVPKSVTEPFPIKGFRLQALLLALICVFFYGNTFNHEAAFDDRMAITDNEYVQAGIAGIGDILTKDAYQSYLEHRQGGNQLAGGRYRPLSLITFAIEQQVLGVAPERESSDQKELRINGDMHLRHVVNVLLYALTVIVLLYFLRHIVFPDAPMAAFIAALIFTVHPIHTEVVANVKSRDEILSVLFICLTFIQAFRYHDSRKTSALALALVCFFLALLSKEYALTLVILLPLSFFIFRKRSIANCFRSFVPYIAPLVVYLILRFSSVSGMAEGAENDIMNNPYQLASGAQKAASEILVLLRYLKLLCFPAVLTADYSYNQLPYTSFSNPLVWVALIAYLAMVVVFFRLLVNRHPLSFALALYLGNLFLVSNFLFNIGAPMGERLVFYASIGFATAVAWLIVKGSKLTKSATISTYGTAGLMLLIVVLCGFKTTDRNTAWKNDETLFLTDVRTAPNSVLVNNNAAAACMSIAKKNKDDVAKRNEWFTKAIAYFDKAIAIYPGHTLSYINRGLCYYNMGRAAPALKDWLVVAKKEPNQENIQKYLTFAGKYFFNEGLKYKQSQHPDSAIVAFRQSAMALPSAPEPWFELAKACYATGDYCGAKENAERAVTLKPDYSDAARLLSQLADRKCK